MRGDNVDYIYVLRCGLSYKIGRARDVRKRMKDLQTGAPYRLVLVWAEVCDSAAQTEKNIHEVLTLEGKHQHGEWFRLTEDDIHSIRASVSCGSFWDEQFDIDAGDESAWSIVGDKVSLAARYVHGSFREFHHSWMPRFLRICERYHAH